MIGKKLLRKIQAMIYKKPVLGLVTWNRLGITIQNLNLLFKSTDDFDLYIVDNGSTDDTVAYLKTISDPRLREIKYLDKNYGLIYALNYTISKRKSGQPYLNMDADVSIHTPNFITNCQKIIDKFPEIGVLGNARPTYYAERDVTYVEISRDNLKFWKTPSILGCLMYFPSETLDKIGYFSEELYLADMELAFRINFLGKWLGFCPENHITYTHPSCALCDHRGICTYPNRKELYCFADYTKNYKHRKFANQFANKFAKFKSKMTLKKIHCGSIHDSKSQKDYDYDQAFQNFNYYSD